MTAARLHARLALSVSSPVDPFAVAVSEGIWLMQTPLEVGVAGYYLRQGSVAGICLNSNEPIQRRRFSAAHELGHHFLGHGSVVDRTDGTSSGSTLDQEADADVFASAFLMPLAVMNAALNRLGIRNASELAETDVYQVSVEIGVSNAAATWRLWELDRLSRGDALRIAKAGTMKTKSALKGSALKGLPRGDLRILNGRDQPIEVALQIGDEIVVRFDDDLSDWAWVPGDDHSRHAVAVERLGGKRGFAFVAMLSGHAMGRIVRVRASGTDTEIVPLNIHVTPGDASLGLASVQLEARIREFLA